jgi:PAS domain S-box-containing protein
VTYPDRSKREQLRLEVLQGYDIMGSTGERQFDDVAALAAQICQTPMAGITLIDDRRQWFIAGYGLKVRETAREDAFCRYLIEEQEPRMLVVPDATLDPRFDHNRFVTGEPHLRFYVGAPLLAASGEAVGALCVMDSKPRTLSAEQQHALTLLSRHVIAQLEARRNLREMDRINRALLSIVEDEQRAEEVARVSEQQMRISNERFQAVLQATNDAVRDWDLQTGSLWWSEGAETQFGLDNSETGAGLNAWRNRIHPDDSGRVHAALDRALRSTDTTWVMRYRFRRSDGSYVMVADRGRIVRDAAGKAVRFLAGMRDITELQALEEQLRQSQRLEAIGQLTGGVAHDFNNLLTVMLGNAEVLDEELEGDPRSQAMARMIANAAQSAADLTRRLLAFARRQALSPASVDVNALIAGMNPLLRRTLAENIEIAFFPGESLSPALVDPGQLESALLNLCINARDAMAKGGRLTIDTRLVELDAEYCSRHADVHPGSYIMVAVSDTGQGIAPEHLPRLFEPFFTTKEKGKGTGLGLAMVYGFVKQSGGHISIYSELGHGTTVRMYLPRNPDDSQSVSLRVLDLSVPRGSETILLVEDDDMVRSYVAGQLESLGYKVLLAANGAAAMELMRRDEPVDLMLTDVMMPGMSGRELADAAGKLRPGLKVLYCSGYSEDAIIHQGRLDPGVELLNKPFRRGELARRLRTLLDAR